MKTRTHFKTRQTKINRLNNIVFIICCATIVNLGCTNQREGYATSFDDSSIDYTVSGKGEPAIVFIHGGLGCDKRVWENQISFFEEKYTVVSLSLSGHGKSISKRTDYTIESFGKDVASVVNELELKKVILVGHSLGGLVSIEAALNLQNETLGIIGLDCLNEFELKWSEDMIVGFPEWFSTDTEEKIANYIREMFTQETDSVLIESTAEKFSKVDKFVFANELDHWFHYQNEKFISSIQKLDVPVTSIQNGDNVITTEINQKYNPNFKGVKLDSLLHFFIISYPEIVNAEIESALQGFIDI